VPLTGGIRIECVIGSSVAGGGGLNVWHGVVADPVTAAGAQALVDRLQTFYTAIAAHIPTGGGVTVGARVLDISQTPNVLVPCTPRAVSTTGAGDQLPQQTALVMALKGAALSRRWQGRVFLPMLLESDNGVGGFPASSLVTTIQTAANAIPNSPSIGTIPFFAIHSRLDQALRPIAVCTVRSTWAVLRSRRP